jgi:molecular chaperone GrpE
MTMVDDLTTNNDSSTDASGDVERMAAEGGPETPAADPSAVLAEEVTALRHERDALHDRLLRQAAEFDNFRKRGERERREMVEYAAARLLQELLPIVDDFERALQADAGSGADAYRQGLEIIHRQLMDLLRNRGVTPIETVGADFDPHIHQAVDYEEAPDRREGEVVAEFRRGYRLGDRLLRPALVKVAKA